MPSISLQFQSSQTPVGSLPPVPAWGCTLLERFFTGHLTHTPHMFLRPPWSSPSSSTSPAPAGWNVLRRLSVICSRFTSNSRDIYCVGSRDRGSLIASMPIVSCAIFLKVVLGMHTVCNCSMMWMYHFSSYSFWDLFLRCLVIRKQLS